MALSTRQLSTPFATTASWLRSLGLYVVEMAVFFPFFAAYFLLRGQLRESDTPAGGTVTVSVESTRAEVRVHVRDTGVGIPADQLPASPPPTVAPSGDAAASPSIAP